ncbi:MAG: ABC transporter ATP-binding protein/permease [Bacteroidia bacterium]|jgi:ABC-type bacteriocin/lantibiotic exporter with double-glycine peptidase domain|nr:ABC transporter ATP-binding protein/permease [Bacteroidia bacterium]
MQYQTLIELAKAYIRYSGKTVNEAIFTEKVRLYDTPLLNTIDELYQRLRDIGDANGFVFKLQYVKRTELPALLTDLSFPLIVFENTSVVSPLLILPANQKQNHQQIQSFSLGNSVVQTHTNNEWMQRLCDAKHAATHTLLNHTEASQHADEVIVISGFPIPSIVSDHHHMSPVQRVFHLMRTEKKDISHIYFYAIMMGLVNLSLPLGIQAIIGLISGGLFLNSVVVLMVFVVVATLIAGWLQILQLSVVEILQQRLFAKAAFEFTYRIPRIKIESLSNTYAPELMNRFFDILTIQKSLPKILIDISTAGVQILFGLLLLAFYHPLFVFFGIVLVLIIVLIFYFTGPSAIETDINTSKYKFKVAYWIEEIARSLNTFKLAGDTQLPMQKLDSLVTNYLQYRKKHFAILVKQFRAIIAFKVFITAGLLVLGGFLVVNRQISLGQFVAAEVIILLVISSVEKLISTLESVYDLITAVDKVGHVTDLPLESSEGITLPDSNEPFSLVLKDVSYEYDGKKKRALSGINLTISDRENVCITGYNGSGKTTLAKVVSGLVSTYSGQVLVNGLPLKEVNINYYRKLIADNLSDQEIFEGTIEQNVTLGKEYSLPTILTALQKAGLTDFVNSLEKGMRTHLHAGGSILSKSVKQKILIARSFVQKPKLLLVDEFFYNAEKKEKQQILEEIFSKENEWAVFIISTDPTIMKMSDKVVLMEEGKIIAQGTYESLQSQNLLDQII